MEQNKSKPETSDKPETGALLAPGSLLGEPRLTLTIEEIKDLAELAGLRVIGDDLSDDEKETEIRLEVFPSKGIEDEGKSLTGYRYLAYFDEYPEEGAMPLGSPNNV